MRAELAHADDDQPAAAAGIGRIGKCQLAAPVRLDEQEIGCRHHRGIGQARQPPHRRLGRGLACEVGQRDDQMGLRLVEAEGAHQLGFRHLRVGGEPGDRRGDGGEPAFRRAADQLVENGRPPPGGVAQERRQRKYRAEEARRGAAFGEQRGKPRQLRLGRRFGKILERLLRRLAAQRRQRREFAGTAEKTDGVAGGRGLLGHR